MTTNRRDILTRRAILGGAAGAVAGLASRLLGAPGTADAEGDPAAVHKGVNNPTSAVTTITNSSGAAIQGFAATSSPNQAGVIGRSNSPHAAGVFGRGVFGVSGFGTGTTGAGVVGSSSKPRGAGVLGLNQSTGGDASGVRGESKSGSGIGVEGRAAAASGVARRGVLGFGKDAGVVGESPKSGMQAFGGTVGIEAFASENTGVAVRGDMSDGGPAAIAGHFIGGGPNRAIALKTQGPIQFGGSTGVVTIPAGETNRNVTGVFCPPGSKIFATMQDFPGLTNNATVQLCARLDNNSFEVLLTRAPAEAVRVAWLIVI